MIDKDSDGYRNYSIQDVEAKKSRYIESLGLALKAYKSEIYRLATLIKTFYFAVYRKFATVYSRNIDFENI